MPKKVKASLHTSLAKKKVYSPDSSWGPKEKRFQKDFQLGIGQIIGFFVVIAVGGLVYLTAPWSIQKTCSQTHQYMNGHEEQLSLVFSQVFDQAAKCPGNAVECIETNRQNLLNLVPNDGQLSDFESTYFVRKSGKDHIEKLFLSGVYKKDEADTAGEQRVMRLLSGIEGELCVSGVKTDVGFSTMKYLKDFDVEAEIVLPFRYNQTIQGAIVRLYGD